MNKAKILLSLSLAANLVAAIMLARNFSGSSSVTAPAQPPVERTALKIPEHKATTETSRPRIPATPALLVAGDTNQLTKIWGRVADPDYKQFVANLRAIGMPEETIQDIVMFDLFKSLGEQMGGLARRTAVPFWQCRKYGPKPADVTNEVQEATAQLEAMTTDLLGVAPQRWFLDRWSWLEVAMSGSNSENFWALQEMFAGLGEMNDLNWMPPGRLNDLRMLHLQHDKARRELQQKIDAAKTDEERAALRKDYEKFTDDNEKAEDAFLTEAERREKELREDNHLTQQLANVDVTRAEYERLHDLAKGCNATNVPLFRDGTPEAAQALNILGAERFAEFQRGADPKYGEMLNYCVQKKVAPETAIQLYDIRKTCAQSIRDGASFKEARAEGINAFTALLGADDVKSYQWMLPSASLYVVTSKDTMETIATKYHVTPELILNASVLSAGATLSPGQTIQIPHL